MFNLLKLYFCLGNINELKIFLVVDETASTIIFLNKMFCPKTKCTFCFLGGKMHDMLLRRVGPDWYQELSPKQLATVDCLQECILKDITEKNITHTKENIASLGLVLRPNHNHLKVALRFCCKCPVEFLLILYQVMNPKSISNENYNWFKLK